MFDMLSKNHTPINIMREVHKSFYDEVAIYAFPTLFFCIASTFLNVHNYKKELPLTFLYNS